jgi:hypothetical protein
MFWLIVGFVFALILTLAWRADHKGTGRKRWISPPTDDTAVGDAKSMSYFRLLGGMGPGRSK